MKTICISVEWKGGMMKLGDMVCCRHASQIKE